MNRWTLIAVLLASCTTFSDLEREHPFEVTCEDGFEPNEGGECVPLAQNNESNTPNNESNAPNNANNSNVPNNMPCEAQPGQCCPTPEGDYCCTDDGCCFTDPSECVDPSNNPPNPNNFLLDQYMLVIADAAPQECEAAGADGPDIFGVHLTIENSMLMSYLVTYQEGGNTQFSEDLAMAVIEQFDPNQADDCPVGESFALGCGGWVGIGFRYDQTVDVNGGGHLTVFESGPQCDQATDRYDLYVCPIDNADVPSGCYTIAEGVEGTLDEPIQLQF